MLLQEVSRHRLDRTRGKGGARVDTAMDSMWGEAGLRSCRTSVPEGQLGGDQQ